MATANPDSNTTEVESYDTLLEEIEKCFKKCHVILETRKEVLLQKVRQMKDLYQQHRDTVKAMQQIEKVRKAINEVITESSITGEKDTVVGIWDDKIKELKNNKKKLEPFCELSFVPNLVEFEHFLNTFHLNESGVMEFSKRIEPCLMNRLKIVKDNVIGSGIAVEQPTNLLYVSDFCKNLVNVFSKEGKYMRSFGEGKLTQPNNLCLSEEHVFITDSTSLSKFLKSGDFVRTFKSSSFRLIPYGICSHSGSVYVCNIALDRVEVFDQAFGYVNNFGEGKLRRLKTLKIHAKQIFVLCEPGTIYVYDSTHNYLRTVPLMVIESSRLFYFTIEPRGNFVISDIGSNSIKIYNPKGQYIESLGNGYLTSPRGLDTDSNNRIVVMSASFNNIQTY